MTPIELVSLARLKAQWHTCAEPAGPEEVYACSSNVAGIVPESSVSKWFTETWADNACSVDLGSCTLASETCTAPGETRLIDGVPVTRPCWESTKTRSEERRVGKECRL